MTVFDVVFLNRELLDRLRVAGIRLDDARYVDLFVDFNDMVAAGNKVTYAVSTLSLRYGVSVRKIYTLIAHFQRHCTFYTR